MHFWKGRFCRVGVIPPLFFPPFLPVFKTCSDDALKEKKKSLLSPSADWLSLGGCAFFSHRSRWTSRTLTRTWARWQTCTHTRISTRAQRTRPCWKTSDRLYRAYRCSPSVNPGPRKLTNAKHKQRKKMVWQRKKKKNVSRLFFRCCNL